HPGERGGARPDLDAADPGQLRQEAGGQVRLDDPDGPAGPAGGGRPGLRLPGQQGRELRDRADHPRQRRRAHRRLTIGTPARRGQPICLRSLPGGSHMRTNLLAAALLAAMLAACGGDTTTARADGADTAQQAPSAADTEFAALGQRWLDGAMRLQPVYATQVGDHRYDDRLGDMSAAGRQAFTDFARTMLVALDAIDHDAL